VKGKLAVSQSCMQVQIVSKLSFATTIIDAFL
jgi:hypothetical protein